jgi:hypothetical protein
MAQWTAAAMKPLGHTGCENGRATPIGSPPPLPSMPCTPGARISPCSARLRLCMWLTALAPTVADFEADCCCRHVLRRLHCSTGACGYPSRRPPAASHQPRSTASTRPAPALGDVALARCLRITFRFPIANHCQRQTPSCSPACRYSNLPCQQRPPSPPHPQGIGLDIIRRHLGMPSDTASQQRHYVRSWRCATRSVLSCADHTELHVTLMASSAPLMHHTHLPLSGSR